MMKLSLYNTLSRSKEEFIPPAERPIKLFVCGPTVYGDIHVGNARTYVFFDFFAGYLRSLGYEVDYLQNITDIDDKIIVRAQKEGAAPEAIAHQFDIAYRDILTKLFITGVTRYEKATGALPEIISQIERLIAQGAAYEKNGSVYFSVSAFPEYGKLSHQDVQKLQSGEAATVDKRAPHDFTLWKAYKEGEPFWDSPWGKGRPGWHIEDTALAEKYFGLSYDIHGGGLDIIFPHHEAEIAQAEAISKHSPYVRYWMHTGLLNQSGEKMSKSLGNIVNAKELVLAYPATTIRYAFLSSHYRSPLDYDETLLLNAGDNLLRIRDCITRIKSYTPSNESESHLAPKASQEVTEALSDDLNTPKVFATLFVLIREVNRLMDEERTFDRSAVLELFERIDSLFTLKLFEYGEIPANITSLVEERESARSSQDWQLSDTLRNQIEQLGYSVKDTGTGPVVRKI